jgi:hypothetical protein
MDRRQYHRYDLQAELTFLWEEEYGPRRAVGRLRDLSGGGAFVCSTDSPPEGAHVRLDVLVGSVLSSSRLVIHAQGLVLRAELSSRTGEPIGFAAAIETFQLLSEDSEVREIDLTPGTQIGRDDSE